MKNELTPVSTGDVIILKSGEIMYVMDIDPLNKINQDDRNRNCNCRPGHIYKKGEEFKKKGIYIGIIEDARNNQVIAIDMSKSKNYTLSELIPMIAANLGRVTQDKITTFKKISADYYDSMTGGWGSKI